MRCVSLFSGCGGLDLGLTQAGFKIILGVDSSAVCATSHKENFSGLAYKVHHEALDLILAAASDLGYTCTWKILNAADYGVPQIRERFFLVGVKDGAFTFPAPTHREKKSKDLFSDLHDLPAW